MEQQATRLKALWKSGRDKYQSFFEVLNEVRREIGDEALASWCFNELRVGMSAIVDATKLLDKIDAKIARDTLAAAKEVDERNKLMVPALQARIKGLLAAIKELEKKLAAAEKHEPIKTTDREAALQARIEELERQLAQGQPGTAKPTGKPRRDRADYMREFMRRKRAAERAAKK